MERENLAGDAKGKGASGSNREAESTDAPERGGLPRSSVEASVMLVERRGQVIADVSKLSGDTVKSGTTVTLIEENTGEKKVWQIVGEPEADVKNGKISVTSPTARALIGKTKGTTIEVEAPGGAKAYKIRQVQWAEDSARNREEW